MFFSLCHYEITNHGQSAVHFSNNCNKVRIFCRFTCSLSMLWRNDFGLKFCCILLYSFWGETCIVFFVQRINLGYFKICFRLVWAFFHNTISLCKWLIISVVFINGSIWSPFFSLLLLCYWYKHLFTGCIRPCGIPDLPRQITDRGCQERRWHRRRPRQQRCWN